MTEKLDMFWDEYVCEVYNKLSPEEQEKEKLSYESMKRVLNDPKTLQNEKQLCDELLCLAMAKAFAKKRI